MNKVTKNASWIIACRLAQSVLALIINMLTARFLGPSNFGLITYAASLAAFVAPIMNLGLNNILVQEIVHHPEREGQAMGTSMLLSLVSAVGCIVGVTGFAMLANHGEKVTILVCLLYSLSLLCQAPELMKYWYQAKLLSKYTSIVSLCAYLVISGYKIYLLATQKSVYWFAISNAFDAFLIAVGIIFIYFRLGGQRLRFSPALGKELFSRSKYYIVSGLMVTIFAQTDKIMIKLMIDETATGYYGAAVACATMTNFFFTAIIDSFRPSIYDGQKQSEAVFEHRLTLLYTAVIYLALGQSAVMAGFAPWIIRLLYGAKYMPATNSLRIIVWYTTFSYLGAVRNIWILAKDKQQLLWKINLTGALVNVALNAVLIPFWGINGAAVASLITQIFTNVITGYIIRSIRPNNTIMVQGLHPKYIRELIHRLLPHRGGKGLT